VRTLYRNGRIVSAGKRQASALLVDGPLITWIGSDDDARRQVGAEHVDLEGALVTPAFVDAHVHMTSTGLALTGLDLTQARSLPDLLDRVEQAARRSRGRPILGGGWDESGWPDPRPPTSAELDRAGYGGSVYLARVDVHSAVASSVLLAAVPELPGLAGYRRDGWLTRDAHDAVRRAAYAGLRSSQRSDAQRAALRHAASVGIAGVHEMAGPSISSEADLLELLAMSRDEDVPEVIGYWGELFGVETAARLGAVGAGGDLFCDGSLGSHTAALRDPYADRPDAAAELRFDTADLTEHIRRCASAGLHAGFHAIGDAAVDQVLDAVEAAEVRPSIVRMEHAEMVRDPSRVAANGVLASMQPMFDATWGGPDGMYAKRLGAPRAAQLNDFAALSAAGVGLAFGSDAPVTPIAPWTAVRAAVHPHRAGSGITAEVAFAAHTQGGWRAAGRAGGATLEVGAAATFASWRTSTSTPGLPDVRPDVELPTCVRTVRSGRTIFVAEN
jgi:predicted amidohydrolase YtcJ